MFNRTKEVPKYQQIHSGVYKFELPYITEQFMAAQHIVRQAVIFKLSRRY
ncbi:MULTISPECIES: hypothetical protein [Bacillus cereus group]|uniref:Uncharacterized protein n=1 Tax=Bacillus thuringiensis TaxID=1428 RepID=A0AB33B5D6_BACTU|nr:hypothetical protein [Bacillus thuringiensis]AJG79459.1 hypothetical protein BF38_5462 [Bacillus thuringiensis]EEM73917.1 hypothetical protein bthur0010_60410 [Bacillus thuringiensis serovar pondicheriensis BGSC 4BA1]MCU5430279.1 hypothetical protein [Bacillus cereus]